MNDQDNKIDWFGIPVIMAFIIGFFGDISFFLIITHYLCGFIIIVLVGQQLKGIPPKLVLGVAFLLPGPFLIFGTWLAILLSNSKVVEFVLEQAAIQAIAIGTGGAGEALEGAALAEEAGALAAEGIEMGAAAAEAGEAGAAAAEGVESAEAGTGEAAESENSRPSEKESRQKIRQKEDRSDEDENADDEEQKSPEEQEEEARKREEAEDYEKLVEAEPERPWEETAERQYFEDPDAVRSRQTMPPKVEDIRSGRARVAAKHETMADQLKRIQKMQEQLPSHSVQEDDDEEENDNARKVA